MAADDFVPQDDDRLDSWKEIAVYLKRGLSTVRRWERTEGLPVHRHNHARRASVYAYRAELDAWFANRSQPWQQAAPWMQPASHWRFWSGCVLALSVVGFLSVSFWPDSSSQSGADERSWRTLRGLTAVADQRPDDFQANAKAASDLLMRANDVSRASVYVARARQVAPEWEPRHLFFLVRTELFPTYEQWFRGNVSAASLEADRVAATLSDRGLRESAGLVRHLLSVYLTLGRFEKARDLVRNDPFLLAEIAAAGDDVELAREHLQTWRQNVLTGQTDGPLSAAGFWLLIRLGLDSGFNLSAPTNASLMEATLFQLSTGIHLVSERRYREAIPLLEDGLQTWLRSNSHGVFESYRALAEARFAMDGGPAAVAVLEQAARWRGRAAVVGKGYFIRNQWWLSNLYRELGRVAEAESLEGELVRLLAAADADHYILVALQARQSLRSSTPILAGSRD